MIAGVSSTDSYSPSSAIFLHSPPIFAVSTCRREGDKALSLAHHFLNLAQAAIVYYLHTHLMIGFACFVLLCFSRLVF